MESEHHLFLVNTRLELWGYIRTGKKHVATQKERKMSLR